MAHAAILDLIPIVNSIHITERGYDVYRNE